MKRVLALLVALLWWCPTACPQELANLRIAVDAEPGTPRTEALVALLRTRFTRVDVGNVAEADVVVLDRWEGAGDTRPDRHWRRDWARPYKPHVVLGGAARGAIPAWNLLGTRAGEPVEGPTERRDPGSTRPGPELSAPLFADGYAPLAFALLEAPDAHVALATRDAIGRPLALVWHQGRFVFFGPGAAADELGAEWKDVLLRCVAYAGGFHRSYGSALSPGASGADAHGELAWRLSGESPRLVGLAALVSDPAAPSSDDAEEWRSWLVRNGPYLVSDAEGRLRSDAGLVAFGAEPSSPGFVASVVARLSAESAEERATARRLLERHVEKGPGVYASRAEWDVWIEDAPALLVYCPSDQRWRLDGLQWGRSGEPTFTAWERVPGFRHGGRASHAADPELASRVPGASGPQSLLRVPFVWNAPLEVVMEELVQWLREAEFHGERELVLRNMLELGPHVFRFESAESLFALLDSVLLDCPALVTHLLAAAGPAAFDQFLDAVSIAEQLDPAVSRELDRAVEVLCRHPEVTAAFGERLAEAAAEERRTTHQREALLGGLALKGFPSDPSWVEPLTELVEREGVLDTPNLIRALAQHGDPRWLEAVRAEFPNIQKWHVSAEHVASIADMGGQGVELVVDLARAGTSAWRTELADHVDLGVLAVHRSPSHWFADPGEAELILRAILRQRGADPEWRDALLEASTADDEYTAVAALEVAARVLSRERSWPLIATALGHRSIWRRRAAAHAVATFHAGRDYARDVTLAATHDEDPWVQATALWALREPLGDRDAAVLARLEEVAASQSNTAPIARHALFRRNASDTPLLDAVHALAQPIATVASGRLDSPVPSDRWSAALWAAQQGVTGGELRRRVEHELRSWIDGQWSEEIEVDRVGEAASTQLVARLGEAAVLAVEQLRPFEWKGNAYAFEGHGGLVHAMGAGGWPLLGGLIFGSRVPLDVPELVWPSLPDANRWLAAMVAQREAHVLSVGRLGVVAAGVEFDTSAQRWRTLGEPGRAALLELEQHPSGAVREHARAVLVRLDE